MRKLLFFGAAVLLGACTADYDVDGIVLETDDPQVAYVTVPDTTRSVTATNIEQIAQRFPTGSVTRAEERTIDEVLTISADDGTPLYYIVNYAEDHGFTVVAATKNYVPVLAYSDKGHFDMETASETGVSVWMAEQQAIIPIADNLPDSIKMCFRAMWRQQCNVQKKKLEFPMATRGDNEVYTLIHNKVLQWQSEGYTVYSFADYQKSDDFKSLSLQTRNEISTAVQIHANPYYGGKENVSFVLERTKSAEERVGPLVQSKWGQESGYNWYVPGNGPVGCTAVATGQIMYYYQYPENLPWSEMEYMFPPSFTTAKFLYDLGCRIGIDYEHGSSSAYLHQVVSALKSYGYTNAKIENHNANHVIGQLRQSRPVIFNGYYDLAEHGHTWICDGFRRAFSDYQFMVMTLEECPMGVEPTQFTNPYALHRERNITTYFSMNWGGYGRQDKFYLDNDLMYTFRNDQGEEQTENFNLRRENVIDIFPNK